MLFHSFYFDINQWQRISDLKHSNSESRLLFSKVLATSFDSYKKRPYCTDFRQLYDYKNVTKGAAIQLAKAGVITLAEGMQEYNAYLDKAMAVDGGRVDEFDWVEAGTRWYGNFKVNASRFVATFGIRRIYESIAVATLDPRLADRVCKDLMLSMKRKLIKYSRLTACKRIFSTALYGNLLMYLSSFTYDVITYIIARRNKKSNHDQKTITEDAAWIAKKVIFYTVCGWASALGFAIGTYSQSPFGATVAQLLLESFASTMITTSLSM